MKFDQISSWTIWVYEIVFLRVCSSNAFFQSTLVHVSILQIETQALVAFYTEPYGE